MELRSFADRDDRWAKVLMDGAENLGWSALRRGDHHVDDAYAALVDNANAIEAETGEDGAALVMEEVLALYDNLEPEPERQPMWDELRPAYDDPAEVARRAAVARIAEWGKGE